MPIGAMAITPTAAMAMSAGCEAIQSGFGSGYVAKYDASDPEFGELYLDGLTLHEGETLNYTVTSVGSNNADEQYGGGFGIYSHNGNAIHEEVWATANAELDVSSSFVVPETRSDYLVYAWGAFGMEDPNTEVTATVFCEADENAPKITSISPSTGGNAGGTPVTITGSNLSEVSSVTIGGQPATDVDVNDDGTQIVAKTPSGAAGAVDVKVETSTGDALLASAFTYQSVTIVITPDTYYLPTGVIHTPYQGVVFGASGSTGPYKFTLWQSQTLPAGLTLDPDTGLMSGTPTETAETGFHVVATDAYGNSEIRYFTLTIGAEAAPVITTQPVNLTANEGDTVTFRVAAERAKYYLWEVNIQGMGWATWGEPNEFDPYLTINDIDADLDGMKVRVTIRNADVSGTAYSKVATLSVGGKMPATLVFSPPDGALPDAMAGEIYDQTVTATGGIGTVFYTLGLGILPSGVKLDLATGKLGGKVEAGAEGYYDFTVIATDTHGNTATGTYSLTVVAPAITASDKTQSVPAGTSAAYTFLEKGATGGPFTGAEATVIEPARAGTVSVVHGEFPQGDTMGPTGWYLRFEPSSDYSGRASTGFRLSSDLGVSNIATVTYTIGFDAVEVSEEMQSLVRDFVRTRQNLIASTIKIPGLLDRRRMMAGSDPATMRFSPSGEGLALCFATSLAQWNAAGGRDGAGVPDGAPFNIWVEGSLLVHNREENGSQWGTFGMVSAGADYLLNEKALLGFSAHYDRMTDPTDEDAELTGNGWLVGPYSSFEIGRGVFWDASLLYGGSANDIDTGVWSGEFDTRRWLFDTAMSGQWRIGEAATLTPKLRATYLNETVQDFSVQNSADAEAEVEGLTSEQLRVSLGAEIARQFILNDGWSFTPRLAANGGFSGLDGNGAFGSVGAGFMLRSVGTLTVDGGLLLNVGENERSVGAKASVGIGF